MKKPVIFLIIVFSSIFCGSQTPDTLYVNYFESAPLSSTENGIATGIEIDIINNYLLWLKTTKNKPLIPKYVGFKDFDQFYNSTKTSNKNTIGLGAVTVSPDKTKEIDFTTPYLKNVAFCVTNGNAPDIKTKTPVEIVKALGSMTALTVTNNALNKYVNELKKSYLTDLKLTAQPSTKKILDEIAKNVLYFGYVDAITFWYFVKNNPGKFVKNQKPLVQSKEEFAFILPKGKNKKTEFNEFFLGFKKTKAYPLLLEKYVGSYMGPIMAVK